MLNFCNKDSDGCEYDDARDPKAEALFAVRVLKPMTAEQLFDSLVAALDASEFRGKRETFIKTFVGRSFGEDFSNV